MKKILLLIILIITIIQANAVEIHQVLYSPNSTEAGGEAIELYNPAETDVNLDGWTIATGVSDQDVTLPKNATINAKSHFLITDIGWNNQKDNSEWKTADYEETMTLTNTNSGILLKNKNGTMIDAVGWGDQTKIKIGHYAGQPAKEVKKGNSLMRISNTGNNSQDFTEQIPTFTNDQSITITVTVDEETEQIQNFKITEDDSPEAGIQILPAGIKRNITITAEITNAKNPYLQFQDKIYALEKTNNSNYTTKIELPNTLTAGNYTIQVFAGQKRDITTFNYLPLSKFQITPNNLKIKAIRGKKTNAFEKINLKNTGNVPLTIKMNAQELKAKNYAISENNILASTEPEITESIKTKKILLLPGMQKEITLTINTPEDAVKDNYTTIIKFIAE